jgi:hypothetical protein
VAVISEAGLGKKPVDRGMAQSGGLEGPAGLRWVESSVPFLQRVAGLPPGRGDAARRAGRRPGGGAGGNTGHPENGVRAAGSGGEGEVFPALARLLGLSIDDESSGKIRFLDGAALHAKYAIAARELLTALAAEQPLVIVCEDIHWADPSSVELALQVIPEVVKAPVVVALVSRPDEGSPGWRLIEREVAAERSRFRFHRSPLFSRGAYRHLLQAGHLPGAPTDGLGSGGGSVLCREVLRMLIDRRDHRHRRRLGACRRPDPGRSPIPFKASLRLRIDRLTPEGSGCCRWRPSWADSSRRASWKTHSILSGRPMRSGEGVAGGRRQSRPGGTAGWSATAPASGVRAAPE